MTGQLVARGLRLVTASAAFGIVSGAVSVAVGLHGRSLGVLAIGLSVLADVTGSLVLAARRFRAERRRPAKPGAKARTAVVVAAALAVVAAVLALQSAAALAAGTRPGAPRITLLAEGVSLAEEATACHPLALHPALADAAVDGAGQGVGAARAVRTVLPGSVPTAS